MTQLQVLYETFYERPQTMLDAHFATGILRASICRRVAQLRKSGLIQVCYRGRDGYTHAWAAYLSTNPRHWRRQNPQLSLFDGKEDGHGER